MIGVFGASGFIGRHVVRTLAQDHDVVAVSRSWPPNHAPVDGVRYLTVDIRDTSAAAAALAGVETVVQLVSTSSPAKGATAITDDIQENVIPHVRFLEECIHSGVSRYIYLSSGGTVYGLTGDTGPTPEAAPTNPISAYGLAKLVVEKLIVMHGHVHRLDYVILRPSNPFGPGQIFKHGQGLIPALLRRYERNLPVTIYGDGSAARDYIYIDDVVSAIKAAIDLAGHRQLTLNIGTGIPRSILSVVHAIEEVAGISFDLEFVPERRTDVKSIALNIDQATAVLDWAPRTEFREGLAVTLADRFPGRVSPDRR